MNTRIIRLAMIVSCVAAGAARGAEEAPLTLDTDKEKASYSLGVRFGGVFEQGRELIDLDVVIRALRDVHEGQELAMDTEAMSLAFGKFQQAMSKRISQATRSGGEAFLAANAGKEGVVVLESGMQYKVLKEGAGATPTRADQVKTHYRGTLVDGKEFDSSYRRGEPAVFPVTRVIAGWTEALLLMKEGSKWELYIPYDLAYGPKGRPPTIPPFAALVFEIELLEVVE